MSLGFRKAQCCTLAPLTLLVLLLAFRNQVLGHYAALLCTSNSTQDQCICPWRTQAGHNHSSRAAEHKHSCQGTIANTNHAANTFVLNRQFIVRFKTYAHAHVHHQALSQALAGEGTTWVWVQRENKAASYATDFGLVRISPQHHAQVAGALVALVAVRDLHPDHRFTRSLRWQMPGNTDGLEADNANLAAHVGSHKQHPDAQDQHRQWQQHDKQSTTAGDSNKNDFDFSITKRPGRITTRFMMEPEKEEEEQQQQPRAIFAYNSSHDRQLLTTPREGKHSGLLQHTMQAQSAPSSSAQDTSSIGDSGSSNRQYIHSHAVSGNVSGFITESARASRSLLGGHGGVTAMLDAPKIWAQGYTGQGVKVGVFDTGIRQSHPHIRNIRERTNWTHQDSLSDGLGHGSFVAGVIGSQDSQCPGFAPDVELYTFKVFTDDQVSFTSWFLDAFNYAMLTGVHVINLSIGGPDYMDQPFVEKVWEVTSSGVLLVSAIGNDGPLYGTLNNPADQNDVIGVGGIDEASAISSFSSRGMTSWELPLGSGRVKPDIMAYSKDVSGSKMTGGCRTLSGTSVASPVVAGAVCLLASTVPAEQRWALLNPASMKQALIEGADQLPNLNMYEQGAGRINLLKSMGILQSYQPRASVVPAALDLTACPYAWPYCIQELYADALPLVFNATVLNALGVLGRFEAPPVFTATDHGGTLLHIAFEYSKVLWPWSGYVALFIRVRPAGAAYRGTASGRVEFTIVSPPAPGEAEERRSHVVLPVTVHVIPKPPRHKRLLWDQFHSIKYPPGYMPRDNLDIKHDILDWHGDHLYTNFHGLYDALRAGGYYVEILSSPMTCFNASQYGALLLVDPEEEYYQQEVTKLAADIHDHGLQLLVFAEWYHVESMRHMRFYDDNTRSWWTPATGGANVPALNDLLAPYGIELGDSVLHGTVEIAGHRLHVAHGADIARVPAGSYLYTSSSISDMVHGRKSGGGGSSSSSNGGPQSSAGPHQYGIFSITPVGNAGGHVAIYGDSNCLDSSHQQTDCYAFLLALLDQLLQHKLTNGLLDTTSRISSQWTKVQHASPQRRPETTFEDYSYVLKHPLRCYANSACELHQQRCGDYSDVGARTPMAISSSSPTTSVRVMESQLKPEASNVPVTGPLRDTAAARAGGVVGLGGAASLFNTTYLLHTMANSASSRHGTTVVHIVILICAIGILAILVILNFSKISKPRTSLVMLTSLGRQWPRNAP